MNPSKKAGTEVEKESVALAKRVDERSVLQDGVAEVIPEVLGGNKDVDKAAVEQDKDKQGKEVLSQDDDEETELEDNVEAEGKGSPTGSPYPWRRNHTTLMSSDEDGLDDDITDEDDDATDVPVQEKAENSSTSAAALSVAFAQQFSPVSSDN